MHIRRSLDESFRTTVEYMVLEDCEKNVAIVSRVLGAFLSEMDPFEEGVYLGEEITTATNDHDREISSLMALAIACDKARDTTTIEMLVPALAAVLEIAQEDKYRVSLLEQYGLLGASFTEFMAKAFAFAKSQDCISVACQAIETWIITTTVGETADLQTAMIAHLENSIKKRPSNEIVGFLSPVLSCYASLQGDEPPEDEKSVSVLQKAFEMCVRYDT